MKASPESIGRINMFISLLKMRKLRHREVKRFSPGHFTVMAMKINCGKNGNLWYMLEKDEDAQKKQEPPLSYF